MFNIVWTQEASIQTTESLTSLRQTSENKMAIQSDFWASIKHEKSKSDKLLPLLDFSWLLNVNMDSVRCQQCVTSWC